MVSPHPSASDDGGEKATTPARVWPVLLAYLVAFVAIIAADLVAATIGGLVRAAGRTDAVAREAPRFAASLVGVSTLAATNAVVLLGLALATARLLGGDLRAGRSRATGLGTAATVVGTIGLSAAAGAVADLLGRYHHGTLDMFESALAGARPPMIALALVAIAIAPGVAEETFFRGLLQTRLVAAIGRWPAILATSLAFGVLHLDVVQGSLAFVLGAYLGWCAERLRGIRPTMAAHAANNAAFVLSAAMAGPSEAHAASPAVVGVVGAAACAVSLAVLRTPLTVREDRAAAER